MSSAGVRSNLFPSTPRSGTASNPRLPLPSPPALQAAPQDADHMWTSHLKPATMFRSKWESKQTFSVIGVTRIQHLKCHSWCRTEQADSRPDSWVACCCLEQAGIWCLGWRELLFGPRMAMLRRCEGGGLWNDEFHEPVEDAGSSSRGHCWGRQCPRDDRRPCFSHRVSSARGVTSVHGHQHINDVTSRQWEPATYQLNVPAPHPKLLPAPKSVTSAHEVTNKLKRPILIQWLPAMLRSVAAACLNYAWTCFVKSSSCVRDRGWA